MPSFHRRRAVGPTHPVLGGPRRRAGRAVTTVRHVIHAPLDAVWEVLADGWLYPVWVVGAARMRQVDDHWPATGTALHHSAGAWPLMIDDRTEVLEGVPGESLRLRARGWPAGEAQIGLTLEARGALTMVTMSEDAVRGPGTWVPKPVRSAVLQRRNAESLRRLGLLVQGRSRTVD